MLTFLVFFPAVGALVIATLPREQERQAKWMALAVTGAVLVASIVVFASFDRNVSGLQFTERYRWLRAEDVGFGQHQAERRHADADMQVRGAF